MKLSYIFYYKRVIRIWRWWDELLGVYNKNDPKVFSDETIIIYQRNSSFTSKNFQWNYVWHFFYMATKGTLANVQMLNLILDGFRREIGRYSCNCEFGIRTKFFNSCWFIGIDHWSSSTGKRLTVRRGEANWLGHFVRLNAH